MKPVNVKPSTYIKFGAENNRDPKFEIGDHVRISENEKTTFLLIKQTPFNGEEIIEPFYEKELQKLNQI